MSLQGKRVFLTGASSGIGAALARAFVRQGAAVALCARRAERLEALSAELAAGGGRALPLVCDVTREGDLERAAAETVDKLGGIDVAIANAGFGVMGRLDELDVAEYRRQFETNIFGLLRTIYATLPALEQSRGTLVLLGSVAGHVALSGTSAYSMTKFAVRALAQALRVELADKGIAVVLISPGFIESEFRHVRADGVYDGSIPDPVPRWLQMSADQAAARIVRAVRCGKRELVLTRVGKTAVFVQSHMPWLMALVMKSGIKGRRQLPGATSQGEEASKKVNAG